MANSNDNDISLTWGGGGSATLTNNSTRVVSDIRSISPDAVGASLLVLCDNAGTPASGDTIDLWIAWSPDGTNFDTDEHAMLIGRLDTFGSNDPGEDPAAKTFQLLVSGYQSFKLIARGNQASSRNITLSATYNEQRMA